VAVIQPPAPRVDLSYATAHGWSKGADPASNRPAAQTAKASASEALNGERPAAAPKAVAAKESRQTLVARAAEAESQSGEPAHKGWIVQIGATDDAAKANDLLIRARAQNRASLASAKPVTEKVKKGEDIFYRARFAGLDSSAEAETACRSLKRSGFSCFTAHD
jgi:D-alanyl-D-alanine carboxypeptidase